jgi:hypothetical protein
MVDAPSRHLQELADLPIAIPAILLGQAHQGETQIVIVPVFYFIAQGAPCDPKNLTGTSLQCSELLMGLDNRTPQVICRQILGLKNRDFPSGSAYRAPDQQRPS